MSKRLIISIFLATVLVGCGQITNTPTPMHTSQSLNNTVTPSAVPTDTSTPTITPTVTQSPTPTETPTPVSYGPSNFPANIDPLTGLQVSDPSLLDRRPVAVKINVVPRYSNRPPWGLSFADIVYDYYHNDGYSRFFAIFYSKDAKLAGPIRSARLLDYDLVHMYQSLFAYGGADPLINQRLLNADFSNRLLLESYLASCPPSGSEPFCRYEPNSTDLLLGDTAMMSSLITSRGVDNGRQNLDGMLFDSQVPAGGEKSNQIYVRYSGDDYTRWDYDPLTGQYLRFQDNVYDTGQGEEYAPLTDRLNDEQISASNVVVIFARHEFYQQPPAEIIDILLSGTGPAYAFRDGQMYQVQWNRPTVNSVLTLTNPDGTPFPFKPGITWFQVVGVSTSATQDDTSAWHFKFMMP
jgi:hypothetical protein